MKTNCVQTGRTNYDKRKMLWLRLPFSLAQRELCVSIVYSPRSAVFYLFSVYEPSHSMCL